MNISKIENYALSALAFPGAGIRYFFYGTKRPISDLMDDGLDINAFAFLWLGGMFMTWFSIFERI
jgi:hypothetical protein